MGLLAFFWNAQPGGEQASQKSPLQPFLLCGEAMSSARASQASLELQI